MDIAKDIKDFLMTRRARITPQQVGLPPGRRRRVPGLRREEVAQMAGVSIEYYTQIERGNVAGVSDDVLHAVARALQLSEAEETHLFDLVRAATTRVDRTRAPRRAGRAIPEGVQALLDSMVSAPAVVINGHGRCMHPSSLVRPRRRTLPGSYSSTPLPINSFPIGSAKPMMLFACYGPKPRALLTRRPSPDLSVSSQPAASNSAPAGRPTMSRHIDTASAEPHSRSDEALRPLASWTATDHTSSPERRTDNASGATE
jgi:transcriptional regulator with XRE-family HTH domain